jgi:formiminotetrahydrofolate cyclodeaminase
LSVSTLALEAFARKLSSGDPTPGGGSAAASVGAFAAALVRMVAALTAGSPKFKEYAQRASTIGAEAERLMEALLRSVDEDVAAFDAVSAAFKMPKSTDAEKAARSSAIQEALRAATEPPMRVVDAALGACRLASELVDFGNPNAISDIGCAALFASAAAQGAALNVGINAKGLKDRAVADAYTERARCALAQVDLLTEVVLGKVQASVATSA